MKERSAGLRREKFKELRLAGQSVPQASASVGVAKSTGYAWSKGLRLGKEEARPQRGTNGFARLLRQSEVRTFIEIEVGGVVIRVPREFDADSLTQLIGVLRRSA